MESTDRFFCPYPGCQRSFIDLWRLKVHYRADPAIRGSGRERGHGMELPQCPKCKKTLERGRHHVRCKAGRATPSQQIKKITDSTNSVERFKSPPRKRRCLAQPSDQSDEESRLSDMSWASGNMTMMPCNVQTGYVVSAGPQHGVRVITTPAFFIPSGGNAKGYFIPMEPLPSYEGL